jgi:methylphosphotriester-DNA--protein-cysteine methyltransferase
MSDELGRYQLIGPDGKAYRSDAAGVLGGVRSSRLYGRLDCPSALRAIGKGDTYAKGRVFFASEDDAIAAGYRPCSVCLKDKYKAWKAANE